MIKLFGTVILAPAFVLALATNVLADDYFCPPDPGPIMVDNVIADTGLFTLAGTTVTGNVIVESGASLFVLPPTTIDGGIHADGVGFVVLLAAGGAITVGEDVQIKNAIQDPLPPAGTGTQPSASGFFVVAGGALTIGGNFQFEDNLATLLASGPATIGGDLQVQNNMTPFPSAIGGNTILGNLQCKENFPAPVVALSGANAVAGNKEDQCAMALGF